MVIIHWADTTIETTNKNGNFKELLENILYISTLFILLLFLGQKFMHVMSWVPTWSCDSKIKDNTEKWQHMTAAIKNRYDPSSRSLIASPADPASLTASLSTSLSSISESHQNSSINTATRSTDSE